MTHNNPPPPPRIDTHAHFIPPEWRSACHSTGHSHPDGMPAIPSWSETSHLEMMDNLSITKSILSITSPGTCLTSTSSNDIQAPHHHSPRHLTRTTNEFAADLKRRHPSRFGFWASVPLPDVEGSLLELAYAMDKLDADGVTLLTNSHGHYLGDETFEPFFQELDRRGVTVFVHPTTPCMLTSTSSPSHDNSETGWMSRKSCTKATPLPQYVFPIFEYMFEDARAVINLFYTGTVSRYPHITYIIPHCGGALPPLIERFSSIAAHPSITPTSVKAALKSSQFYFDLAGWSFPDQLRGLLPFVSVRQLLYGTDYPYTPLKAVMALSEQVREGLEGIFAGDEERGLVWAGNARRLIGKGKEET